MSSTKSKNLHREGFTIIEVMIVLAIAGLIMLIVFLAVPALQRNSRNTQRKNDVSAMLGAMAEWSNNHSGALPDAGTFAAAKSNANLGFIAAANVTLDATATANVANPNNINNMLIVTGAKCNPAAVGDAIRTGASARQFTALYTVETGSGTPDKLCQDS